MYTQRFSFICSCSWRWSVWLFKFWPKLPQTRKKSFVNGLYKHFLRVSHLSSTFSTYLQKKIIFSGIICIPIACVDILSFLLTAVSTFIFTVCLLSETSLMSVSVLQNMVGRGEVDEDLEGETKEECEKYGKVVKCVIFEVRAKG